MINLHYEVIYILEVAMEIMNEFNQDNQNHLPKFQMFQNGFHGLEVANVIKLLQKERRIKRGP